MADNDLEMAGAIKLLEDVQGPHVFLVPLEAHKEQSERELGFRLPPSFCRFLPLRNGSSLPARDMLEANMETRQAIDAPGWYLPEFLVAFYVDGSGNQYCFDTREASAEGEYQVVFWDHELSTEEKLEGLTITEPTFEKWLFRHARETSAPESAPGSNWGACGCGVVIVVLAVLLIVGLVTCIQWLWRLL